MSTNTDFPVYYTIKDVQEYIEETEQIIGFDEDIMNPHPERHKLRTLTELNDIYALATPCSKAVEEIKNIIIQTNDLDTEEVMNWINEYHSFYKK